MPVIEISGSSHGVASLSGTLRQRLALIGAAAGIGTLSTTIATRIAISGSVTGKGKLLVETPLRVFEDDAGIAGEMFFVNEVGVEVPIDVSALTDGKILVWREAQNKWAVEFPISSAIPTTVRDAWVPLTIGNGTDLLTAGLYAAPFYLPQGVIRDVRLWGKEASGSVNIDIWGDLFANVPPTVADTITNGNHLVITTARKVEKDATQLATDGWITTVPAGGYFAYLNIVSVTAFTQLFLLMQVRRG